MSEHLLLQILDKVTKIDDRLDKIEVRLDNIESRLDKVESRLDNLESRLDKVESRLDNLESRLDKVEGRLDNLESRLDKVEGRLDNLETDQKLIKTQVEQNTQILKAVLDRQEETDAKLDVHNLHGELKRVEQKVDANHTETMEELRDIRKDIDFTYQKTALHEKELYKLKNN